MTIKSFVRLLATAAVIGPLLVGFAALSVWAIDAGIVQVTTFAYAAAVLMIGFAAGAARTYYPGTKTARVSSIAFIIASSVAIVAYAAFRWHSESHRVETSTKKNDEKLSVTPVTNTPPAPEARKNRERMPKRRKK